MHGLANNNNSKFIKNQQILSFFIYIKQIFKYIKQMRLYTDFKFI